MLVVVLAVIEAAEAATNANEISSATSIDPSGTLQATSPEAARNRTNATSVSVLVAIMRTISSVVGIANADDKYRPNPVSDVLLHSTVPFLFVSELTP